MGDVTRWTLALLALSLMALWGAPVAVAQDSGELEPPGAEILEEDLEEDLDELLERAEELFASPQQAESIPLYGQIIGLLERREAAGRLDDEGRELIKRSRSRRAEALFDPSDPAPAEAELAAILRLDPSYLLPEGRVSPRLVDLMERVRAASVGALDLKIDPPDAELLLDGEFLGTAAGLQEVLAGPRRLVVRRPGYSPVEMDVEVPADDILPVELALERSSAVVRFEVLPAGVEVLLEGVVVAVAAVAEGAPEGSPASVVVEGLAIGSRRLELRKPGFRAAGLDLEIEALTDYTAAPVALERSLGTIVLSEVAAGAVLLVDGAPRPSAGERRLGLRLDLPPGTHRIEVRAGSAGLFESQIELADRQLLEVAVRLRPALVLLGVLGGDRVAATQLEGRLAAGLGSLAEWALVDRAAEASALVGNAAIDRFLLRRLAAEPFGAEEPDWRALQSEVDRELAGSLYLLAVLSDDLFASQADLWLLASAPGPSRPARRRVSLESEGALGELAAQLDRPLRLTSAWLGARLIDSAAAGGPVVATVEEGGPAAAAGLQPGDRVTAVDGRPVARARDLSERLAGREEGASLELALVGDAGPREATVTLGATPLVLPLAGSGSLDPAVAARLSSLEADPAQADLAWLVQLNRGVLLMRGGEWESAVRALRGITAPAAGGIGQGTVDYLLGVALLETDRTQYLDNARRLFAGVAAGARLHHNDGPLLAPRAQARLETLVPSR